MRRPLLSSPSRSVAMVFMVIALSACGGGKEGDRSSEQASTTTAAGTLQAAVASYDLAVGPPGRFLVGIFNENRGPVGYGTIPLRFFFLGADKASGTPQPGPTANASYLPLPGSPPPPPDTSKPVYLPTDQRGVYSAQVAFDKAGFWAVEATVDLEGPQPVKTAFKVLPAHQVPAPGDAAVPSQNLTIANPGPSPAAVDSRASATAPIPDPELHQTTVAQALAEKWPVLLVISTPTYCVSQFCGPVTDMVAELAKDYANRARFVHIEVWKDYQGKQLNDAAQEWIARGEDVNEPWVFLIGADGKVTLRLDNVATKMELEPSLRALPVLQR